jgi:hypothetical protein
LLIGPVPRTLASVIFPPLISCSSFSVSDRVPLLTSTRLFSFDIGFSFQNSCSQLVIQSLVSIAVLVGNNDAEERVGRSGGLFDFILRKLASTPAGEHPVAIVRHVVSFSAFSKPGEINLSEANSDKIYVSKLWSGWLDGPVTSTLKRVGIKPPDTPSSSS